MVCIKKLAEEEGLEPSDAGIKTQCLNQLGDSPIKLFCATNYNIKLLIQNVDDTVSFLQQNPSYWQAFLLKVHPLSLMN